MIAIAVIGFSMLLIVATWVWQRQRRRPPAETVNPGIVGSSQRHPAGGRLLLPGQNCCGAATALATVWHAEGTTPALPLPGCEQGKGCQCVFVRSSDRRLKVRRETPDRREKIRFGDRPDRRVEGDRRRDGDQWRGH